MRRADNFVSEAKDMAGVKYNFCIILIRGRKIAAWRLIAIVGIGAFLETGTPENRYICDFA
jgi:hypothetical protein